MNCGSTFDLKMRRQGLKPSNSEEYIWRTDNPRFRDIKRGMVLSSGIAPGWR